MGRGEGPDSTTLGEVLCPPIAAALAELHAKARRSFTIISPWVQDVFALIGGRRPDLKYQLIFRGDAQDFAGGQSDGALIRSLLTEAAFVAIQPRLHAKLYIADADAAIIGSANFTRAGLRGGSGDNRELCLGVTHPGVVDQLVETSTSLFRGSARIDLRWLDQRLHQASLLSPSQAPSTDSQEQPAEPSSGVAGVVVMSELGRCITALFGNYEDCVRGIDFLAWARKVAVEEGADVDQIAVATMPRDRPCLRINLGGVYFASVDRRANGLRYHLTLPRLALPESVASRVISESRFRGHPGYSGYWLAGPMDDDFRLILEPALRRATRWIAATWTSPHAVAARVRQQSLWRLICLPDTHMSWLRGLFRHHDDRPTDPTILGS